MSAERKAPEAFSLRRWSQRKLAVKREERSGTAQAEAVPDQAPASQAGAPAPRAASAVAAREIDAERSVADAAPAGAGAAPAVARETAVQPSAAALPPLDSLTFESDFTAFMQPGVDENVRRKALRALLRDPRFNVMDGLDVYIDDYSKPDPIAPEIVRQLAHARYLFDPPKTRVNDEGYVEDVVEPAASTTEDAHETAAQGDRPAGAASVPVLDDACAATPTIEPAPADVRETRERKGSER